MSEEEIKDMALKFQSALLESSYQINQKLQQKNQKLKERIAYLERSNNRREDTILEQRQEISDLEDNWNDLKKYAKEVISTDNELYGTDLLDKIQELEQGSDSNE